MPSLPLVSPYSNASYLRYKCVIWYCCVQNVNGAFMGVCYCPNKGNYLIFMVCRGTSLPLFLSPSSAERQAACVCVGLDHSGHALVTCVHISLCGYWRQAVMAQLSLRLLLRQVGSHSHQVHPSGGCGYSVPTPCSIFCDVVLIQRNVWETGEVSWFYGLYCK